MNHLDLFSGIGGFSLGLKKVFDIKHTYYSEIDKYAIDVYKNNFKNITYVKSVTDVRGGKLPGIDIITFGSPCQDFSIAGKRAGAIEGTRSSLIWEAIRLITECKPRVFVWENVKGTFSSNDGADFWAIIQAFTNIGSYRLEWQLLNTRWFPRTPQNRERIYLVGYTGNRGGRSVFPIGEDGGAYNDKQARTKSRTKFYTSITTREGGRKENNFVIVDKKIKNKNNQDYTATLTGGGNSGGNHSDMDLIQMLKVGDLKSTAKPNGKTIREVQQDQVKINVIGNLKGEGGHECHNVHSPKGIAPAVRENHGKITMIDVQTSIRRLTQQDQHGVMIRDGRDNRSCLRAGRTPELGVKGQSIRRLTPVECMRLQGFPDNHNEFGLLDGKKVTISDTQRYKQAGNAVTVDVVTAVAKKIRSLELNSMK